MHQGGVDNFSAEEATIMLGELYIERRRDGDRINTLASLLDAANLVIIELRNELQAVKGGEESVAE